MVCIVVVVRWETSTVFSVEVLRRVSTIVQVSLGLEIGVQRLE